MDAHEDSMAELMALTEGLICNETVLILNEDNN